MSRKRRTDRRPQESFRFRRTDSVGFAAAEDDAAFLSDCFLDTGVTHDIVDTASPRFLLVGRTGAGKTALLLHIADTQQRSSLLSPDELAINHVANTTILRHLRSIGVNLTPFYKLLWRHTLAEELLRMIAKTRAEYKSLLDRILDLHGERTRKRKAAEYLAEWEEQFWDDTHERVAEVVSTVENSVKESLGADIEILKAAAEGTQKITEAVRRELASKCEHVISDTKIRQLTGILDLINEILSDRQKPHYVLIDRLDEPWVADSERYILTLALLSTIREFNARVTNAKIVVALRRDLLEKVFRDGREAGFQREKFDALTVSLAWSESELIALLDERIGRLVRSRYTQQPVTHEDLLPPKIYGQPLGAFLADNASRPRDIIQFFNACITVADGQPKLQSTHVREALGAYSRLRFDALMEEWHELHPDLRIYTKLLQARTSTFKLEHLRADFEDVCLTVSASGENDGAQLGRLAREVADVVLASEHALPALAIIFYEIGLVGLKMDTHTTYQWVDDAPRTVSMAEIALDTSLKVHPAYWRALGIRS